MHHATRNLRRFIKTAALIPVLLTLSEEYSNAQLYGIDWDSGALYTISASNAAMTFIGSTGVSHLGSLVYRPSDNQLYSFTVGESPALYRINPANANATLIAQLDSHNTSLFEGDISIAPDGTTYACCLGPYESVLFTLDLDTGSTTPIGRILFPGPFRYPMDINGLAWRSDNMLVASYYDKNSLITINPEPTNITLINIASTITELTPFFGSVGGMASVGDTGYFSTAGPGGLHPGSNELYSFDLFTGEKSLIGSFGPTITGTGISGLALITPEPSCAFLGWLASFYAIGVLLRRNRTLKRSLTRVLFQQRMLCVPGPREVA